MTTSRSAHAARQSNNESTDAIDAEAGNQDDDRALGTRLRMLRKERSLSIQRLGEMTNLSTGMLSQIERGISTPSIKSLRTLATALNVPVSWFFTGPTDTGAPYSPYVVRRAARRVLNLPQIRVRKELLTPPEHSVIELYEITIQANGCSGEDSYPHNGVEKAGTVLFGGLRLWLENVAHLLQEGDSFRFPSTLSHRFENAGRDPARVLWVVAHPVKSGTKGRERRKASS